MSKFGFGFWVGFAGGLILAALWQKKPASEVELPLDRHRLATPTPGFPLHPRNSSRSLHPS